MPKGVVEVKSHITADDIDRLKKALAQATTYGRTPIFPGAFGGVSSAGSQVSGEVHIQHRKYVEKYFEQYTLGTVKEIQEWIIKNHWEDMIEEWRRNAKRSKKNSDERVDNISRESIEDELVGKLNKGRAINTTCKRLVKRKILKSLKTNQSKKQIDRGYYK